VCLPTNDTCPSGRFCSPSAAGEYQCALGCTTVADCAALLDGGAKDAALGASIACCNHLCVDTSNDLGHCGSCSNSCVPDGAPPGSAACCASTCYDLSSSATHCGSCASMCSTNNVPSPTCAAATCNGACAPGTGDCDNNKLTNGCETNTLVTPTACGACGNVCSNNNMSSVTCSAGQCDGACNAGFADCNLNKLTDGCEVSLGVDPQHCGGCANVCSSNNVPAPACTAGTCSGACAPGFADCDNNKLFNGCETSTNVDPTHCGGCANACSANNITTVTCAAGVCNGACNAGFFDCNTNKLTDGCEVNGTTDPNNCGACNVVCSASNMATRTCGGSVCNGTCAPGFGDCDNNKQTNGCETNILTNNASCGGCGAAFACPAGKVCQAGACVFDYVESSSSQAFVDACTTGTPVAGSPFLQAVDDGPSAVQTMPIPFAYYGAAVTQYWVHADGIMGFGTPFASFVYACPLPSASDPLSTIFPLGVDLFQRGPTIAATYPFQAPYASGGVCVSVVGAAPNRQMIVTTEDAMVYPADATSHVTFSVFLNESSNTIDIVYAPGSMLGPNGLGQTAAIGLEGPSASLGTTFACHTPGSPSGTPVIAAGQGLHFAP
jgi:hypothetical protein